LFVTRMGSAIFFLLTTYGHLLDVWMCKCVCAVGWWWPFKMRKARQQITRTTCHDRSQENQKKCK
jgi:hypothetical protein